MSTMICFQCWKPSGGRCIVSLLLRATSAAALLSPCGAIPSVGAILVAESGGKEAWLRVNTFTLARPWGEKQHAAVTAAAAILRAEQQQRRSVLTDITSYCSVMQPRCDSSSRSLCAYEDALSCSSITVGRSYCSNSIGSILNAAGRGRGDDKRRSNRDNPACDRRCTSSSTNSRSSRISDKRSISSDRGIGDSSGEGCGIRSSSSSSGSSIAPFCSSSGNQNAQFNLVEGSLQSSSSSSADNSSSSNSMHWSMSSTSLGERRSSTLHCGSTFAQQQYQHLPLAQLHAADVSDAYDSYSTACSANDKGRRTGSNTDSSNSSTSSGRAHGRLGCSASGLVSNSRSSRGFCSRKRISRRTDILSVCWDTCNKKVGYNVVLDSAGRESVSGACGSSSSSNSHVSTTAHSPCARGDSFFVPMGSILRRNTIPSSTSCENLCSSRIVNRRLSLLCSCEGPSGHIDGTCSHGGLRSTRIFLWGRKFTPDARLQGSRSTSSCNNLVLHWEDRGSGNNDFINEVTLRQNDRRWRDPKHHSNSSNMVGSLAHVLHADKQSHIRRTVCFNVSTLCRNDNEMTSNRSVRKSSGCLRFSLTAAEGKEEYRIRSYNMCGRSRSYNSRHSSSASNRHSSSCCSLPHGNSNSCVSLENSDSMTRYPVTVFNNRTGRDSTSSIARCSSDRTTTSISSEGVSSRDSDITNKNSRSRACSRPDECIRIRDLRLFERILEHPLDRSSEPIHENRYLKSETVLACNGGGSCTVASETYAAAADLDSSAKESCGSIRAATSSCGSLTSLPSTPVRADRAVEQCFSTVDELAAFAAAGVARASTPSITSASAAATAPGGTRTSLAANGDSRLFVIVLNRPLPRYAPLLLRAAHAYVAADGGGNHICELLMRQEAQAQQQQEQQQQEEAHHQQQGPQQRQEPLQQQQQEPQRQQQQQHGGHWLGPALEGEAMSLQRLPVAVCGDLDSLTPSAYAYLAARGVQILRCASQDVGDLEKSWAYLTHSQRLTANDVVIVLADLLWLLLQTLLRPLLAPPPPLQAPQATGSIVASAFGRCVASVDQRCCIYENRRYRCAVSGAIGGRLDQTISALNYLWRLEAARERAALQAHGHSVVASGPGAAPVTGAAAAAAASSSGDASTPLFEGASAAAVRTSVAAVAAPATTCGANATHVEAQGRAADPTDICRRGAAREECTQASVSAMREEDNEEEEGHELGHEVDKVPQRGQLRVGETVETTGSNYNSQQQEAAQHLRQESRAQQLLEAARSCYKDTAPELPQARSFRPLDCVPPLSCAPETVQI